MSDYDPTDTTGNEEREVEAQAKAKRIAEQEVEDLKWLMSDKRGRRFMWQLLSITRANVNPYASDPYDTARNCGQMLVGQHLVGNLNIHCHERYNQMVTEQLNHD